MFSNKQLWYLLSLLLSFDSPFISLGQLFVFNLSTSTGHISNNSNNSCIRGQFLATMASDNHVCIKFQPPAAMNLKFQNILTLTTFNSCNSVVGKSVELKEGKWEHNHRHTHTNESAYREYKLREPDIGKYLFSNANDMLKVLTCPRDQFLLFSRSVYRYTC